MQQNFALGLTGNEMKLSGCDCSLSMSQQHHGREARMASGALKRDVVAIHRTWDFHWTFLPGKRQRTFDGGLGRDDLENLYGMAVAYPAQTLTLEVPREDGTTESVEAQFVAGSWKEKLLQRETSLGSVYDLSFSLVEVSDTRARALLRDMSLPWYTSGVVAASDVVAAYRPKGATSLANSYVNIANPGTYDAAPGVAPSWAVATGWTFDGLDDYLTTGIVMAGNDWTVICRYANFDTAAAFGSLFGWTADTDDRFMIFLHYTGNQPEVYVAGDYGISADDADAAATITLTYDGMYRDGVLDIALGAGTGTNTGTDLYIAATNIGGGAVFPCKTDIIALAVYDTKLTTAQQQVIVEAMEEL